MECQDKCRWFDEVATINAPFDNSYCNRYIVLQSIHSKPAIITQDLPSTTNATQFHSEIWKWKLFQLRRRGIRRIFIFSNSLPHNQSHSGGSFEGPMRTIDFENNIAETIIAILLRIVETAALRGARDTDVGQWNGSWFEMIRRTRLNFIW